MRLAVLDTNVLVSAAINSEGAPARIVMDWVLDRQVQTVLCPEIEKEYVAVIAREKFSRYGFPPFWLGRLIGLSLRFQDPVPWPSALPDPFDACFLGVAHAAGAWLVTGNLRHFPARARNGVTVLSPADYLAHLTGNAAEPSGN
jgi:predicted nucleic acid-binding protein